MKKLSVGRTHVEQSSTDIVGRQASMCWHRTPDMFLSLEDDEILRHRYIEFITKILSVFYILTCIFNHNFKTLFYYIIILYYNNMIYKWNVRYY
jgi:hypothetical protein